MQVRLFLKMVIIGVLALVMLIPLVHIHGVVAERKDRQNQAIERVSNTTASAQRLMGPFIVVPYRYTEQRRAADYDKSQRMDTVELHASHIIFANKAVTNATAKIESKQSGIYTVPVYSLETTTTANFAVKPALPANVKIDGAYLTYSVGDVRGIRGEPLLKVNEQLLTLIPGSQVNAGDRGFSGKLKQALSDQIAAKLKQASADGVEPLLIDTSLALNVVGTQSLAFVPTATDTRVTLRAPWPSPSFLDRFSPEYKKLNDGFEAQWNVSNLASTASKAVEFAQQSNAQAGTNAAGVKVADGGTMDEFGVNFYESAGIYQQSERAVKYGVLFILITFAAVFLFETLKQLPVHPIQYGFVGMALAIFFLLVISLSEKMSFAGAYFASAGACLGLLLVYLQAVLRSWKISLIFIAKLGVLYGVLFGILRSDDNALLMGSILLFTLLAGAMTITRKVDWYGIAAKGTPAKEMKPAV
jgi:inner membrane protein